VGSPELEPKNGAAVEFREERTALLRTESHGKEEGGTKRGVWAWD
jgi:hypothetical protein